MTCPHCKLKNTSIVIDARMTMHLSREKKRRRRECRLCSERFTTYECVDLKPSRHSSKNNLRAGRKLGSKNKTTKSNWLSKIKKYLSQT